MVILGTWIRKEMVKTCSDQPDGNCDKMAEMMILRLNTESGHPIFRAYSVLERGALGSKGQSKKSIHFNANHKNIELLLRTFFSVNQLSIYGGT